MAVTNKPYTLIKFGDPLLRQACQRVTFPLSEETDFTIDQCINTLRHVQGFWEKRSMSIAAPQVGKLLRLFVMCDQRYWYHPKLQYKKFMTVINPEIIEASDEKCLAWEACVSENDRIALVERPKVVKVRFQSVKGVEHDLLCHGLLSRIFQHEIDHFEGKIMEDHAQKYQSTKELEDEVSFEKFRKANKDYIIEF